VAARRAAEVTRCRSLAEACGVTIAALAPSPDLGQLVACGHRLASLLDLPCPPDAVLRAKVEYVLYERGTLMSEATELITRTEARDVLLAHLQTLIHEHAGVPERGLVDYEDIGRDVERAWFGPARDSDPPPSIWNVLELIERRPAMYVGHDGDRDRQLDALEALVAGWFLAVRQYQIAEPDLDRWTGFTEYVERRLGRGPIRNPVEGVRSASPDAEQAWTFFWRLVADHRNAAG
jgi:hypothetical protein